MCVSTCTSEHLCKHMCVCEPVCVQWYSVLLPVASGRPSGRGVDESDAACLQAWDVGDKCFRLRGEGGTAGTTPYG